MLCLILILAMTEAPNALSLSEEHLGTGLLGKRHDPSRPVTTRIGRAAHVQRKSH